MLVSKSPISYFLVSYGVLLLLLVGTITNSMTDDTYADQGIPFTGAGPVDRANDDI